MTVLWPRRCLTRSAVGAVLCSTAGREGACGGEAGARVRVAAEGPRTAVAGVVPRGWLQAACAQVHPDGRRAYIGEEIDKTRNGEIIMTHNKSFKSLPIRSWTGGAKVRHVPGSHGRRCPPAGCASSPAGTRAREACIGPPAGHSGPGAAGRWGWPGCGEGFDRFRRPRGGGRPGRACMHGGTRSRTCSACRAAAHPSGRRGSAVPRSARANLAAVC